MIRAALILLLAAPAFAQHVDCEEKINPFHPCHRWVTQGAGGMAQAARGPSEGNNAAPGPAAGSAGPASPGTSPGKSPGKGGHKGHGGKGKSHGK